MDKSNSTRHSAGSSLSAQTDEFAALSRRLLVAINQILLVSQHFGDLAGLNAEDVPAGLTLHQAAKDLDQLYNELDSWDVLLKHPSRQLGVGVFKDDGAERSPLSGLPPAMHCPFCGRHDDIMVSQIQADDHEQGPWFRCNCGICGVDAPGDDTALGAAQQWNRRGIDPTVESAHTGAGEVAVGAAADQ